MLSLTSALKCREEKRWRQVVQMHAPERLKHDTYQLILDGQSYCKPKPMTRPDNSGKTRRMTSDIAE